MNNWRQLELYEKTHFIRPHKINLMVLWPSLIPKNETNKKFQYGSIIN